MSSGDPVNLWQSAEHVRDYIERADLISHRAEGEAQGRTETAREDIYEVLDARGLQLSPEHRQRIAGCEDLAQLKAWLRLAATATSVEQLLAAAPKSPGSPAR